MQLNPPNRLPGLDAMRAAAIGCVLYAHTAKFAVTPAMNQWALHYFGYIGVEIFFVLSGFLIGGILLRLFTPMERPQFLPVLRFWGRRWLRTLPNYYVALVLVVLYVYWASGHNMLSFPTYRKLLWFGENLTEKPPVLWPIAWSLAVEEWFYLVFPVVGLVAVTFLRGHRATRATGTVAGIIVVMSLWLRWNGMGHADWNWPEHYRKMVVLRLDGIAVGVAFACVHQAWPALWMRWRHVAAGVGLALGGVLSWYFWQHGFFAKPPLDTFAVTAFFPLFSLAIGLLLPWLSQMVYPRGFGWLDVGFRQIARFSYGLYLYHMVVVMALDKGKLGKWSHLQGFFIAWGLSFAIAAVAYYMVERPFLRLRDRYVRE